jgi:hypothetical protein
MSIPYCTGPAFFFVNIHQGSGSSGTAYFGTCERTPRMSIEPSFTGVMNDLGGQKIPYDELYDGEHGFVSADFSKYNEGVYAALAARPYRGSPRGTNGPGDIGTLMMTEGYYVELWVQFPYSAKAAFMANAMPAGYHFPVCTIHKDDLTAGTVPKKVNLLFHALRGFSNPAQGGTFTCYDHNMTGLPAIN